MLYTSLKFVHVLAAAAWLGGALAASLLGAQVARLESGDVRAASRDQLELLGGRLFGPAAGLTLLAGIATAVAGNVPMSSLWIVWGYAGVLVTGLLGGVVLRRTSGRLEATVDRAGPDAAATLALRRRVNGLSALNLALLASTIWAMVAKPTL